MSYDQTCYVKANDLSCQRQYELAKRIADQETSKLRYMIQHPACQRMTQLADRTTEHTLTLGRAGLETNNAFTRVLPQFGILDFPNNMCLLAENKK